MQNPETPIVVGSNLKINHKSVTDILGEINMDVKVIRYMFLDSGEVKLYDCQDSKGQLWLIDNGHNYEFYFINKGFKPGAKKVVSITSKWLFEGGQPAKVLFPYETKVPFKQLDCGVIDMAIGETLPSSVIYAKWEAAKHVEFPLAMYLETGAFDYKRNKIQEGGYVTLFSGLAIDKSKLIINNRK